MRLLMLVVPSLFALVSACASNVEVTPDPNAATSAPTKASAVTVAAPAPAPSGDPQQVIARAAGAEVKLGDIDAKIAAQLEKAKNDYATAVYEARKAAIDAELDERVLAAEAKKRGVSVDQLTKTEIDDKAPAPSDADVQSFYEQNKDRMDGQPFEAMKDRIAEYLGGDKKRARHGELLAELRKTYGAQSLLEPQRVAVDTKGPVRGKADAKITVVVFADFQCPYCAQTAPTIDQLQKAYPDDVKVVFKHYPLDFHEHAMPAAEAAVCADEQGKFWELHDKFFAREVDLETGAAKTFLQTLPGFDGAKFDQCISSGHGREVAGQDLAAGIKAGVDGTPAFFINGVKVGGARPYEDFQAIVVDELGRLK